MAKLMLQRSTQYFGHIRSLKIKIDTDLVVNLKSGETKTIEIPAGSHSIQASMDWCKSPILQLVIEEEETKKIKAGSVFFPMTLLFCFIPPFHIFTLEEIK